MNKEKDGAGVSQANVPGVPQNASGVPVKPTKPVKPKKKWRSALKVIAIIILVMTLINIAVCSYFSPDNKVKRYLHAKYGSNRELTVDGGCFSSWLSGYRTAKRIEKSPWEWSDDEYEHCSWRASFKDDPKHIFNVWLDDNYGNRSLQDNYNEVKSEVSSED